MGSQLVKLGVATAATGAALFVNPYGAGFIQYVLEIQRNPIIQTHNIEWFAPSLRNPEDLPLFGILFAGIALLALAPKRADITDTVVFLACSAMALQAERN